MHWWQLEMARAEKPARSRCTLTLDQTDARWLEKSGTPSALKIEPLRHTDPPR